MLCRRLIFMSAAGLALAFTLGLPTEARADLYGFSNITNNNAADAATGEAQLSVEVTSFSPTQVLFEFTNVGPNASSITDVYFDDLGAPNNLFTGIGSIVGSAGVSFAVGANPGDLPGGNEAVPSFVATSGLTADSDPPAQPNGVNPGEWLQFLLNLDAGESVANVIGALDAGSFRIGIHVQGFAGGGSESFVNGGNVVPLPGAVFLAFVGLTAAGLKLRKWA